MGLLIRWVRAYQCLSLHITFWRGAAVRLRAAARRRAMTTDARPLLSASHPHQPHRPPPPRGPSRPPPRRERVCGDTEDNLPAYMAPFPQPVRVRALG